MKKKTNWKRIGTDVAMMGMGGAIVGEGILKANPISFIVGIPSVGVGVADLNQMFKRKRR